MIINSSELRVSDFRIKEVFPPALEVTPRGVLHTRGEGLWSLQGMDPKRFALSVDDDTEFRARCDFIICVQTTGMSCIPELQPLLQVTTGSILLLNSLPSWKRVHRYRWLLRVYSQRSGQPLGLPGPLLRKRELYWHSSWTNGIISLLTKPSHSLFFFFPIRDWGLVETHLMNEWVLISTCKNLVWSTRIGRIMPIWILFLIAWSVPRGEALSVEVMRCGVRKPVLDRVPRWP
jgi:hypothetical protein